MKLKTINNNKGSALLWCVLMTVILTILLGSLMTASYAYFSYTIRTVKRQQAYFTARSAMNAVLEEFASEEQERTSNGTYGDSSIPLLPTNKNEVIKVTDFNFEGMGTATAEIKYDESDKDKQAEKVIVTVNSTYADQDYHMTAKIARQPVYVGGIPRKSLVLNDSNFELAEGTDLYFYTARNDELLQSKYGGVAKKFDTTVKTADTDKEAHPVQILGNSNIVVNGNLVTQGDATIGSNMKVAGFKFNDTTNFTASKLKRKIWNANQFIISNKTLEVSETNGNYSTNITNVLKNLSHTTLEYCNNTKHSYETGKTYQVPTIEMRGFLGLIPELKWVDYYVPATFGAPSNLISGATSDLIGLIDDFLPNNITKLGTITSDNNIKDLAIEKTSSDALATQYIELLSLSNSMRVLVKDIGSTALSKTFDALVGRVIDDYGYTVKDISYIAFDATTGNSYGDNVTPLTYLLVEDGLYVRVKYGQAPDYESPLNKLSGRITDSIDSIVAGWTGITKSCSCVIVYLGENATLELGTGTPHIQGTDDVLGGDKAFTPANQTYFYTIYGMEGSTVKLKGEGNGYGNVPMTFIGAIECDNLEVSGDVSIIYTSTNGSQVAKQKVAEYWTVINYSD